MPELEGLVGALENEANEWEAEKEKQEGEGEETDKDDKLKYLEWWSSVLHQMVGNLEAKLAEREQTLGAQLAKTKEELERVKRKFKWQKAAVGGLAGAALLAKLIAEAKEQCRLWRQAQLEAYEAWQKQIFDNYEPSDSELKMIDNIKARTDVWRN